MRDRAGMRVLACLAVVAMCLLVGSTSLHAQSGSLTWSRTTRGPSFDRDPYFDGVAQGPDGSLVMVGVVRDANGRPTAAAWRSANGSSWKRVSWKAPKVSGAAGIAATSRGFVAVGGGRTWTSRDGRTWTAHALQDSLLTDIDASGDMLVSVGLAGGDPAGVPTLWSSADGSAWTALPLGSAGRPARVAAGPDGTLVVAGDSARTDGVTMPLVWHIRDEVVTPIALPGAGSDPTGVIDLRWTPAGFVLALLQNDAGHQAASLWVSMDGTHWRRTLDLGDGSITALGTFQGQAIAFGTDRTWQSADGQDWLETNVPVFQGSGIAASLELADGRLLAVGARYTGPDTSEPATFLASMSTSADVGPAGTTIP